jgi:hypothetical protein
LTHRQRSKVVADNSARPRSRGVGRGADEVSDEARVRCDGEVLDPTNGAATGQGWDMCGDARPAAVRPIRLPIQTICFSSI